MDVSRGESTCSRRWISVSGLVSALLDHTIWVYYLDCPFYLKVQLRSELNRNYLIGNKYDRLNKNPISAKWKAVML